jgi:hypothetical protein
MIGKSAALRLGAAAGIVVDESLGPTRVHDAPGSSGTCEHPPEVFPGCREVGPSTAVAAIDSGAVCASFSSGAPAAWALRCDGPGTNGPGPGDLSATKAQARSR